MERETYATQGTLSQSPLSIRKRGQAARSFFPALEIYLDQDLPGLPGTPGRGPCLTEEVRQLTSLGRATANKYPRYLFYNLPTSSLAIIGTRQKPEPSAKQSKTHEYPYALCLRIVSEKSRRRNRSLTSSLVRDAGATSLPSQERYLPHVLRRDLGTYLQLVCCTCLPEVP